MSADSTRDEVKEKDSSKKETDVTTPSEKILAEQSKEQAQVMMDPKEAKKITDKFIDTVSKFEIFEADPIKQDVNDIGRLTHRSPVEIVPVGQEPTDRQDDALQALQNKSPEELTKLQNAYKEKYGSDLREDLRSTMSADNFHRANAILNGERDPGYMGATVKEAEDALKSKNDMINGKKLEDFIDAEQLVAIQKNEISKRGVEDDLQDSGYWPGKDPSIGPAQLKQSNIDDLRNDLRNADLKDVDPRTPDGAQKFVAAYLRREAEKLSTSGYAAEAAMSKNLSPKQKEWLNQMQTEWNDAVERGDREATRKILAQSFNRMQKGQDDDVEAKRDTNGANRDKWQETKNSGWDILKKVGLA